MLKRIKKSPFPHFEHKRVLLKRIQEYIDVKLREEQAGFREQRSCNEQIFTLRNIIMQSLEFRSLLIINCRL